jgi:hypothetical protein
VHRQRLFLASVVGIVGLTGTVAALAAPRHSRHVPMHPRRATASSVEQLAVFSSAPAASQVPGPLRAFAADPETRARFALDVSEARQVSPAGTSQGPWYLVPSSGDVCLYDGSGGVCGPIQRALAGQVFAILVPHESLGARADAAITIRGIAPNGASSVRAAGTDGRVVAQAAVNENVYELRVAGDVASLSFDGATRTSRVKIGD